jgi:hypothetical protein
MNGKYKPYIIGLYNASMYSPDNKICYADSRKEAVFVGEKYLKDAIEGCVWAEAVDFCSLKPSYLLSLDKIFIG